MAETQRVTPGPRTRSVWRTRTWSFAALLAVLASLWGCASLPAPLAFHSTDAIRTSQLEWRGDKSGAAWLKRHYRVVVDVRVDPSNAVSRLTYHGLRARFGAGRGDEVVRVLTPKRAIPVGTRARVVRKNIVRPVKVTSARHESGGVDPEQRAWTLRFPPLAVGEVLEVITRFDIPGTLVTDARPLGVKDAPTGELLVSYHVPTSAVGQIGVEGHRVRPVVANKDGYRVMGLLLNDVPASGPRMVPYVRYVTRNASPRNYDQLYANSWAFVVQNYQREFSERTIKLRENATLPLKATEASLEGLKKAYRWVRDRIQRADALRAHWSAGQPLPANMMRNNLTATDKVHLLHWLIEGSGLRHEIAMGRSRRYPRTSVRLPAPGLFDAPLLYVSSFKLWLDPACQACVAGQVRPSLRGRQAIIVVGSQGVGTIHTLPR